jgi:uncharacterized protein YjbI with pentapeptide repeats/cellulose biosynthesis protein BcsQ
MKILAISSGKGGVGKTTITLNIARQLSLSGFRTLILDFDIHNKGATCLFMDKVSRSDVKSIIGIMHQCTGLNVEQGRECARQSQILDLEYGGNLFFLPAARPDEMVKWESFVCNTDTIVTFFGTFIRTIAEAHRIDTVLIDCYGGVDTLTISAAGISDDFIIVNEPDVITFAGTLLLYKQLEMTYAASEHLPSVHFVINRVSGRFSSRFLRQEYQRHLSQLAVDRTILAYLPFDKLVFDTFGDYPFFSELLPKGLYAKKIHELIARLWPVPEFVRLTAKHSRQRERIYQVTAENPFADPERIFQVWKTAPAWALLPATVLILLYEPPSKITSLPFFTLRATFYMCLAFVAVVLGVLALFEPWQVSRWLLRKSTYEKNRRILRSGAPLTGHLRGWWDHLLSLAPAGIGSLFFFLVCSLALNANLLSPPFRNFGFWRKQVTGLYSEGNYRQLVLGPGASIKPRTDLSSSHIEEARLSATIFPQVNLTNAHLESAVLERAKVVGAKMNSVHLEPVPRRMPSRLGRADLSASEARNGNFSSADLSNADFWATDLSGAVFTDATLYRTDFRQSNLRGANFKGAKIYLETKFDGADLTGADFEAADFDNINDTEQQVLLYLQLWFQGAHVNAFLEDMLAQRKFQRQATPCPERKAGHELGGPTIHWWRHFDTSKPAHLCDVVEPTIRDKQQELQRALPPKTASKDGETDERVQDIKLCDPVTESQEDRRLCSLLIGAGEFGAKTDLIELLLIRGANGDLRTAGIALDKLRAEQPSTPAQQGIVRVLKLLHAIICGDPKEPEYVKEWLEWRLKMGNERLGWEWETFNDSFPARLHSSKQAAKIHVVQLSATGELTVDQTKWWFVEE